MASSVKKGKIACPLCREMCSPDEMYSASICQKCHDIKQAKNQGKPRPKSGNGSGEIKRNAMGWVEREEKSIRSIDEDGYLVTDTSRDATDIGFVKPIDRESIEVTETGEELLDGDYKKPVSEVGNIVSETLRIGMLETLAESQGELLAEALRRIKSLETSLSPVIEKENAKADSAGLAKLRDDLEAVLKKKHLKTKVNGIYVSDLYGANGRRGGGLGISKMQAFRLRDVCRLDDRFRVEKAENKEGKWLIRLNTKFE